MEETRLTVLYNESRASRNEIIDGFWEIFGALPNIEVIDSESQGVVSFKIYGRYLMTSLNAFNLIINRLDSNASLRINGRPY
jgi:hypothetical protein